MRASERSPQRGRALDGIPIKRPKLFSAKRSHNSPWFVHEQKSHQHSWFQPKEGVRIDSWEAGFQPKTAEVPKKDTGIRSETRPKCPDFWTAGLYLCIPVLGIGGSRLSNTPELVSFWRIPTGLVSLTFCFF